jgi:hypothetical protein
MKWLWTWGGECFGYIDACDLWSHDGRHVGKLHGEEIFGSDGRYLGEVKGDNRLITCVAKKTLRKGPFTPHARRTGCARYANYVGYIMYIGYEDFPTPSDF